MIFDGAIFDRAIFDTGEEGSHFAGGGEFPVAQPRKRGVTVEDVAMAIRDDNDLIAILPVLMRTIQ